MTTYIALFNLTEAGIKAAKDLPRRLDAAKKLLADMGGEMKQFYMVMGEFDFVGIRGTGRRRHGPFRTAARGPRLRAHEDAEGVPGDRLPRNHPLARLSRASGAHGAVRPGESYSDVNPEGSSKSTCSQASKVFACPSLLTPLARAAGAIGVAFLSPRLANREATRQNSPCWLRSRASPVRRCGGRTA